MSNGDGGMSIERSLVDEPSLLRGPGTGNKVTSSFCSADKPQCVQVHAVSVDGGEPKVVVTDTKQGAGSPELHYTREEWEAFVSGVKAGEFDYDRVVELGGVRTVADPADRDDPDGSGLPHVDASAGGSASW